MNYKICDKCNRTVAANMRYCLYCGAPFDREKESAQARAVAEDCREALAVQEKIEANAEAKADAKTEAANNSCMEEQAQIGTFLSEENGNAGAAPVAAADFGVASDLPIALESDVRIAPDCKDRPQVNIKKKKRRKKKKTVKTSGFFFLQLAFVIPVVGFLLAIILNCTAWNSNPVLGRYAAARLLWGIILLCIALTFMLLFDYWIKDILVNCGVYGFGLGSWTLYFKDFTFFGALLG